MSRFDYCPKHGRVTHDLAGCAYCQIAALEQERKVWAERWDRACIDLNERNAEVGRLRAAVRELADDCEQNVKNEYGWPDVHPAVQPKFDRDMKWTAERRALTKPEGE